MKKTMFVLILAIGQLAAAATPETTAPKNSIPEGYICVNPKDVSIWWYTRDALINFGYPGDDFWIRVNDKVLFRKEKLPERRIDMTAGFVVGVSSAATQINRSLLINPALLANLANTDQIVWLRGNDLSNTRFAKAMLIDVDNLCAK